MVADAIADASLREVVVVASAAVLSEVDQISAQEEEGVLRLLQVDRSEVGAVVEKVRWSLKGVLTSKGGCGVM